jgi:hypothetical protein
MGTRKRSNPRYKRSKKYHLQIDSPAFPASIIRGRRSAAGNAKEMGGF